ncbi:MAG: enoyl-CoA hydratase [Bacteroidetes bacterium RIFOXYA12_FULL_35_11]|nr:MAG: enoyl-CoA hydratase [Bacteroidetes bacterium GWF2_35_48]OFY80744.1 MAG: enoyl-CoA hydratase [Bacteroidetes bacterium RIFOXYA12_FULL_35_11]OFY92719.1 MAG: enoyl-CoA hydratase [Bacteroidetes bacterium RIFOXYC12_FULL_35_7]OFY97121.1 MAG: enoyl-CoA hydratase [Bacteroidetes bacterium RIFOXYB2_FULL_35_7]HBX53424.1 enoyl-CoA hydratase [Bacteroidales bacterium]
MKIYETLEIEIKNYVGTIWMNRPDLHNAMNQQLIADLIDCVESMNEEQDVRIVVLRGKGKSFCAGADLNYMKGIANFGFEENYQDSLKLAKCFNAIYTCRKPSIAIVQGAAIGGANGLLAACDFVYCADDTKFAFSEVKLGIVPATISPYVMKRIGEYGSRELMISGRRFTGKEAEWYRLANKSLPIEELDSYVASVIEGLMTSGPEAMSACKKLIYTISNKLSFEDSIDYTARTIAEMRASKEGQEGMASFLEKRKPNWVN